MPSSKPETPEKTVQISSHGWTLGMALVVLVLMFLCFSAFAPTPSGKNLRSQATRVQLFMAPAMASRGIPFEISAFRDSWFSSTGHDLALILSPRTLQGSRIAAKALVQDLHARGAVRAVSQKLLGTCTVIVSGEAVEPGHPIAALVSAVGDENLAWKIALLHESAHCIRNPAVDRYEHKQLSSANGKNSQQSHLFSLYFSEAYADAYSVLALGLMDPLVDVQEVSRRLVTLRQSGMTGPVHRTDGAIREAARLVLNKTEGIAWGPDDLDRLALESAFKGSSSWLQFMHMDAAQIEPGFFESLKAGSLSYRATKG